MKYVLKLLVISALLFLGFAYFHGKPAEAATYTNNNIMDDAIFDNVGSMNGSQIDSWLSNNYPHGCLTGFYTPDLTGYSPSTGFTYGGNVSAGTAIYHAAQAYGINPQVIIATLQKESSVVSGDASYRCNYINTAMGYDCPDSGSCPVNPATESGFSKQIIHAAWMLRFHEQRSKGNVGWQETKPGWDNSDDPASCYSGRMTQGSFRICPNGAIVSYDGLTSIDGTSVHLDTGATAALYDYTPHFAGNRNFVNIFTNWFGETHIPAYAWQPVSLNIYDEGKNTVLPTDNLRIGERLFVDLAVKNNGNVTWTNSGPNAMKLGTDRPYNRLTPYCDTTWSRCDRAAFLNEASVAPGDIGHFQFYAATPNTPGVYRQYFRPVSEDVSWMSNDAGFNIYMNVGTTISWNWSSYDAWTDQAKTTPADVNHVGRGQDIYVVLRAKNTSPEVWSKTGSNPFRFGTFSPLSRNSAFCSPSWLACNRLASMDQATVVPGQTATFSFTMHAPNTIGQYREYVKPLAEDLAWGSDNYNHIYINVDH